MNYTNSQKSCYADRADFSSISEIKNQSIAKFLVIGIRTVKLTSGVKPCFIRNGKKELFFVCYLH